MRIHPMYPEVVWMMMYGILTLVGYLMPNPVHIYIYISWPTEVEGIPKAPFLIATTPRFWGGCYSLLLIAPLYP